MNIESLRAVIQADPALMALVPDAQAIADAIAATRTRTVSYMAGKGDVVVALGFDVGNAFCDLIDTEPLFRHVKQLLEGGRMDLGLDITQAMLDSLVGQEIAPTIVFAGDHAAALKALCTEPMVVSEFDVRRAIWNDDGSRAV